MERTNFFFGLLLAFFSPTFYREVAKSWRGRSLLAILVVLVIFWSVLGVSFTHVGIKALTMLTDQVAPQMPVIMIQNGTARTEQIKPSYIYLKRSNTPFVIVDTHDQIVDPTASPAMIVIRHDKVVFNNKSASKGSTEYKLPQKYNGPFGGDQLKQLSAHFVKLIVPLGVTLLSLIAFAISYIFILILNFILGLFAWLLAAVMNRETGFWSNYHIALMAWIPTLLINMVLFLFSVRAMLFYLTLLILYTLYGVISVPSGRDAG